MTLFDGEGAGPTGREGGIAAAAADRRGPVRGALVVVALVLLVGVLRRHGRRDGGAVGTDGERRWGLGVPQPHPERDLPW